MLQSNPIIGMLGVEPSKRGKINTRMGRGWVWAAVRIKRDPKSDNNYLILPRLHISSCRPYRIMRTVSGPGPVGVLTHQGIENRLQHIEQHLLNPPEAFGISIRRTGLGHLQSFTR